MAHRVPRLRLGAVDQDAFIEQIKKNGGEVVGTTGVPLGTADMAPFVSKISGNFDGLFGIFFGANAVSFTSAIADLGLTKKYKYAGDGAIAESTHLAALGQKIEGFVGINRYIPVMDPPLNTPYHKKFFDQAVVELKKIDPSGPLPDRYVQSNFEAMNFLKLGMQKSRFRGREDTMNLIEALEGMEVKESDDFPQGDKTTPEGRSPGVPARVHLHDPEQQAQAPGDDCQGEDDRPAGLQVRVEAMGARSVPRSMGRSESFARACPH